MRILRASCGWSPSVRTLQRHFGWLELTTGPDGCPPQAFGRLEAAWLNEWWTGDALHGPRIACGRAYLFAFLDDHSRAVMAACWGYFEDSVRPAAALRRRWPRGCPRGYLRRERIRFCRCRTRSGPPQGWASRSPTARRRSQGRGKIDRFLGIVRQEFLLEVGDDSPVMDLTQLNRLFTAWHEMVNHTRPHGETGSCWLSGGLPGPRLTLPPGQLREASVG